MNLFQLRLLNLLFIAARKQNRLFRSQKNLYRPRPFSNYRVLCYTWITFQTKYPYTHEKSMYKRSKRTPVCRNFNSDSDKLLLFVIFGVLLFSAIFTFKYLNIDFLYIAKFHYIHFTFSTFHESYEFLGKWEGLTLKRFLI